MKIVIVGGTSALAQALISVLSEFADLSTAGRNGCDIRLDLIEPAEMVTIPNGTDAVINTAAHFGGSTAHDMQLAMGVNVLGALKLCQACSAASVKHLVHISSISADISLDSPYYSIYSLSKRQADEAIQLYSSIHHLPVTILKPSQMYGPNNAFRKHQPLLYTIIDKAAQNEEISIFGSHDAMRNFIYIDDVTDVIAKVIRQRILGNFTCTGVTDISFIGIASAAISAFRSSSRITFLQDKPDIADNIFPRDDRLYRLINYFPQVTMDSGMRKIAAAREEGR